MDAVSSAAGPGDGTAYLVVFEDLSCFTFPLPGHGKITIGRGEDVDIRLQGNEISRRHTRLLMSNKECWVSDEQSQNGTFVNGELLQLPRCLLAGDVIAVGNTTLVYHRAPVRRQRQLAEPPHLRQRLMEEMDRCARYQRQLALLCLQGPPEQQSAREQVALTACRDMDIASSDGRDRILLLLPEVSQDDALRIARQLLEDLAGAGAPAAVGLAACPTDAGDADALISSARAAASAAKPREVVRAAQTATTLSLEGHSIVLSEPVMVQAYERLRRCAATPISVLLYGETGVGKDLAARALHAWSHRKAGPFLALNCAALPESLAESELFGYQRGAFTGAVTDKAGLLEAASGGTLFLDEIGDLALSIQAKLLRAIETHCIQRVGGLQERPIDLRLVCATHRDLRKEVQAGRFRQDLYYRIRGAEILLPPLRDRRRELPLLAQCLLAEACASVERPPMTISSAAMLQLINHSWPGNVRELRSVMEVLAATCAEPVLLPWHLQELLRPLHDGEAPRVASASTPHFRPLEEEVRELECTRITEAMAASGYVQARAAELLRMPEKTFRTKVKLYKIPVRRGDA